MTEEEKGILQGLIDDIYDQFLDVIVQDRKINKEDLKKIADGRVFSGRQEQSLNLIDALGDRSYAVRLAGNLSGIKGTPELVYPKKQEISFWDYILQSTARFLTGAIKDKFATIPEGVNFLYEYGF